MVMSIRVLTPDRVICSTQAEEVILPGLTGQVGILDGHATLRREQTGLGDGRTPRLWQYSHGG